MQAAQSSSDLAAIQTKIVNKQFDEAIVDLESVLQHDAGNVDALYMQAVCNRYLRNFTSALDILDRLKRLAPDHSRAHQEEGHTHRDAGRPKEALRAYARACALNPALEASWRGQLHILQNRGSDHRAVWAQAQLERLQSIPKPLIGVMDLIAQGRLLKAEDICRQFLQKVPHHVEGMRLLADIGKRLGVLDDAEFLAQLEAATSVRLMLRDVFEARTIGSLAALVEGAGAAEQASGQADEEIEEFKQKNVISEDDLYHEIQGAPDPS